jgi:hypothetical protein
VSVSVSVSVRRVQYRVEGVTLWRGKTWTYSIMSSLKVTVRNFSGVCIWRVF